MKIVQISSLWETTPPPKYGGLELVVSNLTEELVTRGHEVTLFATGDSQTKATLKSVYPHALYRDGVPWTSMYDTLTEVAEAVKYAREWGADIIHNHQSHRGLAMLSLSTVPFISTVHGTLESTVVSEDKLRTFKRYGSFPFASISDFQRTNAPDLNWITTAYNGIDQTKFEPNYQPQGEYIAWVGRITETKGVHILIEVAKRLNRKLLMAAKLDKNSPKDLEYFEKRIKPELNPGKIEWIGEVDHAGKTKLLRDALVFVNPILWDEPFGLVVPEANACGVPVVSFERGSMRELIKPGINGQLVVPGDVERLVEQTKQLLEMPNDEYEALRRSSRQFMETHFTVNNMVDSYEVAYEKVTGGKR